MANKFARTVGGNWTADATWSTTSGGAADTVAPTASDDVFLDANSGNVTISATSVGKSLTCTGYTGTLTQNANITFSGNVTFVAGMTYTAAETTIISFNADTTFISAGKNPNRIVLSGTNVDLTLGDNLTLGAFKTTNINLSSSGTTIILNGFTLSGNSATNRVLIQSGTLGSSRTITNTTGTFANADFRDITFSTNADYSAITGLSGDCGGNSGATLTAGTTQTYTGGTGSWSDVTKWTSRVPLPQDNVSMSGVTGGTITADMPRLGKSIDWTGASGSPTWSANTVAMTLYGSLTMISGMTFTSGTTGTFTLESRTSNTLTSAGKSFGGNFDISEVGGTLTLQDAFSASGTPNLTLNNGTFNSNSFNVSFGSFVLNNNNTKTLTMGSSLFTLSRSGSGNVWNGSGTGTTLNANTSTILISDTGANSKTFAGNGLTYNDLKIAGGGAGAIIITGANTFNRIYTDGGGTKTLTFPAGATTTLSYTGTDNFGNAPHVLTINSSSGGSAATLSKPIGRFEGSHLSIQDSTASGTFFAGSNSTNVSGNSGWQFRDFTPNQSNGLMAWLDALDGGDGTFTDRLTKTSYTVSGTTRGANVASGTAMVFDGTNDKITMGNIGNIYSIAFWISTDSTTEQWIDLNGTQAVQIASGTIAATSWTSPTIYVNGVVTSTLGANTWSLVAITSATAVTASAVVLGQIGADYGAFSMTGLMLFDRILTATEIGRMYNRNRVI